MFFEVPFRRQPKVIRSQKIYPPCFSSIFGINRQQTSSRPQDDLISCQNNCSGNNSTHRSRKSSPMANIKPVRGKKIKGTSDGYFVMFSFSGLHLWLKLNPQKKAGVTFSQGMIISKLIWWLEWIFIINVYRHFQNDRYIVYDYEYN